MYELPVAFLIFVCLVAAAMACLLMYEKLPPRHRQEDTHSVVKSAASLFVVMTSLVMGLMINSTKNTFEAIDHNVHTFATELILLDKTLREYGPDTKDTRQRLLAYVQRALDATWPTDGAPLIDDGQAERLLADVEASLEAIRPTGAERIAVWRDARLRLQKVVELRWALVEQSEGNIPTPLIVMLVTWLMLIFASFGYRAPRNGIVVATVVAAAALIAGSIYLVLDMNMPFSGPIQVSPAPMQRAIAYMQR